MEGADPVQGVYERGRSAHSCGGVFRARRSRLGHLDGCTPDPFRLATHARMGRGPPVVRGFMARRFRGACQTDGRRRSCGRKLRPQALTVERSEGRRARPCTSRVRLPFDLCMRIFLIDKETSMSAQRGIIEAIKTGDLARVNELLEADPALAGSRNEMGVSAIMLA